MGPPDRRKKTTSGFYSTSADVLEAMLNQQPVILPFSNTASWPLLCQPTSSAAGADQPHRPVHTSFSQTGSHRAFGFVRSHLQNIPPAPKSDGGAHQLYRAEAICCSRSIIRKRARGSALSGDPAVLGAFRRQDIRDHCGGHLQRRSIVTGTCATSAKGSTRLIYGINIRGLTRYTDLTLANQKIS